MPIVPFLRTTFLLSSLTVTAAYALYNNNPAFREWVDRTIDQINKAFEDILATLSPQERERQRDRQRHVLLSNLSGQEVANVLASPYTGRGPGAVTGVSTGVDSATATGRERRRALWEIAEANAAEIRGRAAARGRLAGASLGSLETQSARMTGSQSSTGRIETLFSAFEAAKDASTPARPPQDGSITASSALHSHNDPTTMTTLDPKAEEEGEDDNLSDADSDNTETYDHILTPPSPSLRSVSSEDNASVSDSEVHVGADGEFYDAADADPPVDDIDALSVSAASFMSAVHGAAGGDPIYGDGLEPDYGPGGESLQGPSTTGGVDADPPVADIDELLEEQSGEAGAGSVTPSTISMVDSDGEDEVMSLASGDVASSEAWSDASSDFTRSRAGVEEDWVRQQRDARGRL